MFCSLLSALCSPLLLSYTLLLSALCSPFSSADFVSLNRDFQLFVARVSEAVSQHSSSHFGPGPIDIEKLLNLPGGGEGAGAGSVKDALGDIVSSIRENIVIRRAEVLLPHRGEGVGGSVGVVASYVHAKLGVGVVPAHIELGKVAAVVLLQATGALGQGAAAEAALTGEVGRRLAMHVVASQPSPLYLSIADVPADVLLQETAIFREQSADDKKKADIVERIVAGKVAKRMGELCLLQQAHVAMEGSPVVHKYLESMGADGSTVSLTGFQRWSLGQ
jgi:translation elongation factor EF-Ts